MTIFKTILWTSLFWIIVIVGLWVSSLFFPYEATIIIPAKVKSVIIEDAKIEAIDDHEVVKVEEKVIPDESIKEAEITEEEIIAEESPVEKVISPVEEETVQEEIVAEPAKKSLIPQPTQEPAVANAEIEDLQNRVTELESEYAALVEELRTIFGTPVFTQLLWQAFAENQVTDATY